MCRPHRISGILWNGCMKKFEDWLQTREGIVVYENRLMDSSHFGEISFMPAKFYAEESDELQDAPEELRPNGGLPSLRQQKIDHIRLEEFDGDVEKCLKACFEIA